MCFDQVWSQWIVNLRYLIDPIVTPKDTGVFGEDCVLISSVIMSWIYIFYWRIGVSTNSIL